MPHVINNLVTNAYADVHLEMSSSRINRRRALSCCCAMVCCTLIVETFTGCQSMSRRGTTLSDIDEGLMIPVSDRDAVWEKVVDVLHVYQFQIISENHLEGVIETDYKVGASLIEPWHRDSVGFHDRFESTLQSIRRKVFISVSPSGNGQCVSVEVHKEIEDVDGKAYNSPGGATFQEYQPFRRDLRAVVGQSAPSGWIFQGRDAKLEQALLRSISREFE